MFQQKWARRCAIGCAAAAAMLTTSAAAGAAPGPVFALKPVTSGPYYVFHAHPGQTISGRIRIVNAGSAAGSARIYAVDATTGPTSGASYLTDSAGAEVGAWTKLSTGRVTLRRHKSVTVRFTVRVPKNIRPGDHLGGIVADPGVRPGRAVKRGKGAFRINVRTLTVIAVEVQAPGKRVRAMAVDGIAAGGLRGYQQLLIALRNTGNVLQKGSGSLLVETMGGRRLKSAKFNLDTFVPRTGIRLPVPVRGRALPTGSYRARVTVHYSGRTMARWFVFKVTNKSLEQVFGSKPSTAPKSATHGMSLIWLIAGGVVLLLLGFLLALVVFKRRVRRAVARARERDLSELDLWGAGGAGVPATEEAEDSLGEVAGGGPDG